MKLKRPMYGPDDPRGPTRGRDVVAVKRALWKVETSFFPRPAAGFDEVFNRKAVNAVRMFQRIEDLDPTGHLGQRTLDALEPYMDEFAKRLYSRFVVPVKPEIVRCFPIAARFAVRNFGGVDAHMSRPLGNWQSDNAVDIGCPERSQVLAITDGKVVKISGHDPDQGPVGTVFGQHITIECANGLQVFYTHQKMHPQTEVGERVVAGEMLSFVADFGGVGRWPEHLHIAWSHGDPDELWDERRWPRVRAGDPD